jgi:uncharacterized protein YbgA (DUF1722 family)/uncharacterized protein YbbK (DUF523 family)
MDQPIKLGISSCLLGENVRYDGGHKLDPFLRDTLGLYVEYVPVCPETECGLGVPRESMRLVGDPQNPRLVETRSGVDHTEKMKTWAQRRLKQLEEEDLCGFIFKKNSPSSGLLRVKVYNEKGMPMKAGSGIFARAFVEHFPRIPVEEEGRLHDPGLRENFIGRIFTLKRWREVLKSGRTLGHLADFHTRHKLLLLSHSPRHYREMGRIVATGKQRPLQRLFDDYEQRLLAAVALKSTIPKNVNVLHHLLGYFKKQLAADEKQEVLEVIENYRAGHLPLVVPLTLINHFVRKYRQPYLAQQVYLNPHPVALRLRTHV